MLEPSPERPSLSQRQRRVGAFGEITLFACVEMTLRRAMDAERLFKLQPKRRKLGIRALSRLRPRGRRQRRCGEARRSDEQRVG
jgi:hypothetical protein